MIVSFFNENIGHIPDNIGNIVENIAHVRKNMETLYILFVRILVND